MPEMVRSFAEERQQAFKDAGIGMKWVRVQSIHLTLQFLGEVDADRLPSIQAGIETAVKGVSSFSIKANGLGVFPNLKRPRVLWVGLAGQTEQLKDLHRKISGALVHFGFPKDNRVFKGHLTIGRAKGRIDKKILDHVLLAQKGYETPFFKVQSVCLFKSRLTPRGAVYTKLAEASLNVREG